MKFSINRRQSATITTFLVVLALGACYFFFYLPNNEKRLQKQSFRSLQNIDRNVHAKIENSVALLNNLLNAYQHKNIDTGSLRQYIKNYPQDNFTLEMPDANLLADSVLPQLQNGKSSVYTIRMDDVAQQFSLLLSKADSTKANIIKGHRIGMRFRFEQFIKPLLPGNVFDEYIVFGNDRVVYETFPSGLAYFRKDSLLNMKGGIGGSGVKTMMIGGVNYKLFLQPVSFDAKNQWVIAGLLSSGRYQQEKDQLPFNIVLFLLTVALAIIISFPWIKLFNMGSQDRVTVFDGIWTIVVSILLMSLLFLVFFKYNVPVRPVCIPDSKEIIAERIAKAFTNETAAAYNRLHAFDSVMQQRGNDKIDVVNLGDPAIAQGQLYPKKINRNDDTFFRQLNDIARDIRLTQVFWLDGDGREVFNWTADKGNAPHGNFKTRDYFKRLADGVGYSLAGKPFYLDQVVSWTSGSFISVLSLPSGISNDSSKFTAALSFNMKSLDSVILPAGYIFAIIDNAGKVLYHSDKAHNLNENLLNEFSANSTLSSCLQARSDDVFYTKYFGREYITKVRQIPGLPLSIVVMGDKSFKNTRDIEVYSFPFAMFFCFFLFFGFQLLVLFLVAAKRSFFKKQLFDTSWIGPKRSFHRQYMIAGFFQLAMIVVLCCFFNVASFLQYVFILFLSVSFITLFLNILYLRRYHVKNNHRNFKYKRATVIGLAAFIVLINVLAIISRNGWPGNYFVAFELIALLLGLIFYRINDAVENRPEVEKNNVERSAKHYTRSFTFMVLSRLVISSGLPVAFFYVFSYNYEQNLATRYKHYEFANAVLQKYAHPDSADLDITGATLDGVYGDSAWVNTAQLVSLPAAQLNSLLQPPTIENEMTHVILKQFRFYKSEEAVGEKDFSNTFSSDTSFVFNDLLAVCKGEGNTVSYIRTRTPDQYIKLSSLNLNYQIPCSINKGCLFWILLLATLYAFYLVLHTVIRKIFSLNLPETATWGAIDKKLLSDNRLNKLLFIIGAPGAGKLNKLKRKIKEGVLRWDEQTPFTFNEEMIHRNDVFVVDMILIPDVELSADTKKEWDDWNAHATAAMNRKNQLVIINHFEYNIKAPKANSIKLNFLETLMYEGSCKIIILSTIHPVSFLDSVNDAVLKDKIVPDHELERWHVLLGHYRIVIEPLVQSEPAQIKPEAQLIVRETEYTHFLQKMQDAAIEVVNEMPENTKERLMYNVDSLAFKLQVTAHYFYMYIWQSLTKEEKFLLYDLAEDGLVNSFDDYNLSLLVTKGIIVDVDGTLRFFNNGFRNFILTAIGNTEMMQIKDKIRDNGSWGSLRTPLMVITVAILTFLFVSQQEVYSSLITYVTAIGAGVPAVVKLLSFFEKNPQKSN